MHKKFSKRTEGLNKVKFSVNISPMVSQLNLKQFLHNLYTMYVYCKSFSLSFSLCVFVIYITTA